MRHQDCPKSLSGQWNGAGFVFPLRLPLCLLCSHSMLIQSQKLLHLPADPAYGSDLPISFTFRSRRGPNLTSFTPTAITTVTHHYLQQTCIHPHCESLMLAPPIVHSGEPGV